MNRLMNASDIYISLHKSEGFGLTLMESILLNKPTLTTNYSGNIDFCKKEWSELVEYKMIDVEAESNYSRKFETKKASWAMVDINDASKKLNDIYMDIPSYEKRARMGAEWIRENYNLQRASQQITEALCQI